MDPLRFLSDTCTEMRDAADQLRQFSNISNNDVSDVFEVASSILATTIQECFGKDPNENALKDCAEFEQMAHEKEKNFTKKMEDLINSLSNKVNFMQDKLSKNKSVYNIEQGNFLAGKERILKEKGVENEERLKQEAIILRAKEDELKGVKDRAFQDFDSFLADQLQEIQGKYISQLQEEDDKASKIQLQLQEMVHSKHEQKNKKSEDLDNENKRMAKEHERITHEYQQLQIRNQEKIKELNVDIDRIQKEINDSSTNQGEKIKSLEKELTLQHERVYNEYQEKLTSIEYTVKEKTETLSTKRLELERDNVDFEARLRDTIKDYETKIQAVLQLTKELIDDDQEAVSNEYEQKVRDLQHQIDDLERERQRRFDELEKKHSAELKLTELEILEENKSHQEKLKNINDQLKEVKANLRKVLEEKARDIEEFKHQKQQLMGEAMHGADSVEKERAQKITEIMKKFDDQQKRLMELHQMSVEKRDKYRADALMKLKNEHDQRKEKILKNFEKRIEVETEKNLKDAEEKEKEKHDENIGMIEGRLREVQGRIQMLQLKMDGLAKMQKDRLADLIGDSDKDLASDLQKAQEDGNSDAIANLKERLNNESYEVERRKGIVLQEAEQINENLHTMQDNFQRKLAQMEHQFNASKQHLKQQDREVTIRKDHLVQEVGKQRKKINELSKLADEKVAEADDFERTYDHQREEFRNQTKSEYDRNLEKEKNKPLEFERQMSELKITLTEDINDLQAQLDEAKKNTEKMTEFMMKERSQLLEETEVEINLHYEEKKKILDESHSKRIEAILNDLQEAQESNMQRINEIETNFEETMSSNKQNFIDYMEELRNEEIGLTAESRKLDEQIHILTNAECKDCVAKKEILRQLLAKKKEIQSRISNLSEEAQEFEVQMNYMFGTQKMTSIATPDILPKAPKSPHIAKPRAKTALGPGHNRQAILPSPK